MMEQMPRARMIKPGFFINDNLVQIEALGRLLFAGLWCIADREGRLEDRPLKIKMQVLPADNCDVDGLLDALAVRGFIIRYEVNGDKYIQIVNWQKHQNPHKNEIESIIPPAPSNIANIREDSALLRNDSGLYPCILDTCILGTSKSSSSEVTEQTSDAERFPEDSESYKLALLLRNKCFEHHPSGLPKATVEGLRKWAQHIDYLIRLDEQSPEEVRKVIEWCQQDSFWYANIRSPDKLRKQYGQLVLKMQEGGARAGRITGKPEQITPEHQARIDKYAKRRRPDMPTGEV